MMPFKTLDRLLKLNLSRYYTKNSSFNPSPVDLKYYLDPKNHGDIIENAKRRGIGDKDLDVLQHLNTLADSKLVNEQNSTYFKEEIKTNHKLNRLLNILKWLPNKTHPNVVQNNSDRPFVLEVVGKKPSFEYHPATFDSLTKRLNVFRNRFLGPISGRRSYFLKQHLADLEHALVQYTLRKLVRGHGFRLISVPDILPKSLIERCGMKTNGEHSQIFHISPNWEKELCLSGTAEMALGGYVAQKIYNFSALPLRLCSVSRCHRAEAKTTQNEKGIFRVHHFTKVEMFGVTCNEDGTESETLLKEFVDIQRSLFSDVGLHFQILEMPATDMGLPAYHKIDIEAWMPGRKMYGEISSASNCTDFQSRRLNVRYRNLSGKEGNEKFCHTVNGTACAVPRMLIALFESLQNLNGSINIPVPLQRYMNKSVIQEKFDEKMLCLKPVG